ncbi:MAG: protein-disulfide reductase DsbD [Gallionellaceae bacterium]|jgi:thiol:disulfide interchange protein DsbD
MRVLILLFLLTISQFAQAEGFLERLGGTKQASFLAPDQAFSVSVDACDKNILVANFNIAPGYYLYRDKLSFALQGKAKITSIELPQGESKNDPTFGLIEVYHQSIQAKLLLENVDSAQPLSLTVGYQGCSDKGLCYPPVEKILEINQAQYVCASPLLEDGKTENENTQIANIFEQGSFWLVLTFFFGAGLLLAFTPCVFPMVPILSGIIVGRGHKITHFHAFILSLAYVLGMALTYAAAGIAAGFSGELISNALQTPLVLGSFAAVFVILSLSMFGFYEIQLPSALQSRLTDTSNKLHGGHLSGVFGMGALSAIIMSPCVAAPMAGALLYIGKTHDAVLGGSALFALAMGMGAPLLLIGTSAGALLPKAGAWMESVKRIFGVMMLALAIWIISPIVPVSAQMLLWAVLLIFCAIYLHALDTLPQNANGWRRLWKGLGVIALLLGVAYLVGGLSGARDILRPLGTIGRSVEAAPESLRFERIKSSAELDARIAQAQGKKIMLDFYADWCVSCKEMERFTFSDAAVQGKLKEVILLQADVTANNADDKTLLQRFQLFGPPAILFIDGQGKEQADFRVIGFQNAGQFISSLKNAGF